MSTPFFPFEINILAFNRPTYLKLFLESLSNQSIPIDPNKIFFWQDEFIGSKDEFLDGMDNTEASIEIIQRFFPSSKTQRTKLNLGIGLNYQRAEAFAFRDATTKWALFFEEDLILHEHYLKQILQLISAVENYSDIVQVDATGDVKYKKSRSDFSLFVPAHNWGFALRAEHYFERKTLLNKYEHLLQSDAYFRRDDKSIFNFLKEINVSSFGTSQDLIKRSIATYFRKLTVTTGQSLSRYIGENGENFSKDTFNELGYSNTNFEFGIYTEYQISDDLIRALIWELTLAQSTESLINIERFHHLSLQLIEKQAVIKNLEEVCLERLSIINRLDSEVNRLNSSNKSLHLRALLEEKVSVMQVLSKAVTAYKFLRMFSPTWAIKKTVRIVGRYTAPRLGNLNQYEPLPLQTIPDYKNSTKEGNLPTISIITPSYRQGEFIERTILSVLNQNYPKLEYHVQDGGSQDNTIAILKNYEGKLSGWISSKDSGQSQAINLGFTNTSGEIMAWLNSDDLLLPGALAIVADYFYQHPEIDLVYGNRLLIDEKDMEIGRWILPGHDSDVLSWVDYIPQETMFWRRSLWNKVGGKIDESFKFAMDWDLLLRFREADANVAHIPRFLGAFRIHEQQKTSAVINEIGHHEMNRIRERCLGKVPTRKEIRNKVIPFMFKHIVVDIIYQIKKKLTYK